MKSFLVLSLAFLSTLTLHNPAYSLSVICNERNMINVYSSFTTRAVAESWYPEVLLVDGNTVQFGAGDNHWYTPHNNSLVKENTWELTSGGRLYKVKYVRKNNKLLLMMSTKGGYKQIPPATYRNCIDTSSSSSSTGTSNKAKSAFRNLSVCNRKYVQQFMKSQGLYSGSIDGQWGPSTAAGVNGAKKLSKLKNLSSEQVIAKLSDNLVCN